MLAIVLPLNRKAIIPLLEIAKDGSSLGTMPAGSSEQYNDQGKGLVTIATDANQNAVVTPKAKGSQTIIVNAQASDGSGNTISGSFFVNVVDAVPGAGVGFGTPTLAPL